MTVDVLPAQDAVLWWVQRPDAPLQIGGLAIFEGASMRNDSGALRIDELRARIDASLAGTPRFRQRMRTLPLGTGAAWVDDEHFDLARHVRSLNLPAPGGDDQLRQQVSRIIEQPLDPDHPLWEISLLDGLAGDRVALVVKASHVLVDGMALVDLTTRLLDPTPEPPSVPDPAPWRPVPAPGPLPLLATELRARVDQVAGGLREAGALLTDPTLLGQAAGALRRLGRRPRRAPGPPAPPASRPPLTGRVGRHRDLAWECLPLDDIRAVAHAESVTVNDVVLALATGALARYAAVHPLRPPARDPRAIVPISVHGTSPGDEVRNQFAVTVTDLPVGLDDPLERLHAIHSGLAGRKTAAPSSAGGRVFGLVGLVPPRLLREAGRALLDRQPVFDLAVTNLRGPADPRYLMGGRLLEVHPWISGTGNIATIIGVMSYADTLGVCATVATDVVGDPELLVDGFARSLDELLVAIEPGGR